MNWITLLCIATTIALVASDNAEELATLAKVNVQNCSKAHSISGEIIKQLHKPEDLAKLQADEPTKCFIKCLMDRSPIAENGSLHKEKFVDVFVSHGKDRMLTEKLFGTCNQMYAASNNCNSVWDMFLCFNGVKY